MKKLLFIIIMLFGMSLYGQRQDSVIHLSKTDVVTLANKIRLIRDSLNYKGAIIFAQDTLIQSQKRLIGTYKEQVSNANDIIRNLNVEKDILEQTVELMKPKWYENKWIWFCGGFATACILVKNSK